MITEPTLEEAIARVEQMRRNLDGALGSQLRRDRAALDALLNLARGLTDRPTRRTKG